jgi:hypothetical protein
MLTDDQKRAQTRRMATSKLPDDQIFVSENHGMFNASKMQRMYDASPRNFELRRVPIDATLLEYIFEFVTINRQVVLSMSTARRDEPVLVVTLIDKSPLLLIDGHHRIVRRHADGLDFVDAIIMSNKRLHTIT